MQPSYAELMLAIADLEDCRLILQGFFPDVPETAEMVERMTRVIAILKADLNARLGRTC